MMLSPDYLDKLPDRVVELYSKTEQEILSDMARRLIKYDYWIPSADWQYQKLLASGALQSDILAALSRMTGKSSMELRRLMKEAGVLTLHGDTEIYSSNGLTVPEISRNDTLKTIINAGLQQTLGEFRNLTRTTANTATQQFERALDEVWMKVSSGAFDVNTAVRSAVKQLCTDGVQSVRYPSGHRDTLEVAVRRAAVTGINQTASRLQLELADELGCDLVETSAHAGARPSHEVWQGQIFSRSGESDKYPDFISSTGYGTGAGLCGWNCRHNFAPYIEGSPRTYSEAQLAEYAAKKYIYNGEQLTEYEAQQKQRYFERQLRRWKREYAAMGAAGLDTSEAAAKVKQWENTQADFINQTGLKRQCEREQVAGFGYAQKRETAQGKNYARASDIFRFEDVGDEVISPDAILSDMQTSEVGRNATVYLENGSARVNLVYEKQPHDNRGWQQGDDIMIFVANIKSPRVAAQTVIHEVAHHEYGIGGCQWAEAVCMAKEKMHLVGRPWLTYSEKRYIVALAKSAYPEYNWKRGGYWNGKKF